MGEPGSAEKAVIFIASLFSRQEIFQNSLTVLKNAFGNILLVSSPLPWNFSTYYDKELGTPLLRSLVFFDTLVDSSCLSDAKILTNRIEMEFSKDGKRQINLDPGYMTLAKVVLASTKNYSHRIYLGKGIYGELSLIYSKNRFIPLSYTYRDYRDEAFLGIFMEARNLLRKLV
ncbi:MAG: DUF4416 family protein [Nitrospirota bacterium]